MLVYKEYFNIGVSSYISYIAIYLCLLHALPPFVKHYQMSLILSLKRLFPISAGVCFGRNSVANGFNSFFFTYSFAVVLPSQCHSNGYSSWLGWSSNFFPKRNSRTGMILFLPIYSWLTMPIFHCFRLSSSPLTITTSPTLIFNVSFCVSGYVFLWGPVDTPMLQSF